jgi:hypothetical protein
MRLLLGLGGALVVGCSGPAGGTVSLVLDIPNATLDPKGYSSVDVRLHHASGDTEINVAVDSSGQFDLGEIDAKQGVMIEAALRTDSGAAVGYGRAAAPADLEKGAQIVIPVRRPIIYFAGLVNQDVDGNPNTNDLKWSRVQPTFSDLAAGTVLDGTTTLSSNAVMTVTAGPNLYIIDQMPMDPTGALTGTPTVKAVSTGDHSITGTVPAMMSGGVLDAAGSDDGKLLLVGTTTQLFLIDTDKMMAKPLADGSFARVAIVSAADGAITALAIKNRSATGACTAELLWVTANADDTNQVMSLGTSGYTDVAGDIGRGFYVDNCKGGELGEATATGALMIRGGLGKPTALAVSNGRTFIGIEKPGTPAGSALISTTLNSGDAPRTLFDETGRQVVEATQYPGVQRSLPASSVTFTALEVGAGGDYVAITTAAKYAGNAIPDANFPKMEIDTQELRVFDASTGAAVQRYRSWCDGILYIASIYDIPDWGCSTSPGQTAPTQAIFEHQISSMTFQFGKK